MTHRLRVTYRKQGAARYVAHLDLMRTWERAIRRAHLPLTYSQGFTPHPKLQLAAPLPVGTASEGELIDIWLDELVTPEEMRARLTTQLPGGLEIVDVSLVEEPAASLQAASVAARYEVRYPADLVDEPALSEAIAHLLALETLPWEEARGDKVRSYDLRAAILDASVRRDADEVVLAARLSLRGGGSARPSSLARAVGLGDIEPLMTTRIALELGAPGSTEDEVEEAGERGAEFAQEVELA